MSKTLLVVGSMGTAMVVACLAAGLMAVEGASKTQKVTTLVGAGDIAECDSKHDSKTAKLLGKIRGTVFTLGDNVYPEGTSAQFSQCYDPIWGIYKERTKPTAGDQDYKSSGAEPYFDYFGERAGEPGKGYYSYDRGTWHIVALNSNCEEVGGCERHSAQGRWLRTDLNNNPQRCTLAYFHHPLYASGTTHDSLKVKPM